MRVQQALGRVSEHGGHADLGIREIIMPASIMIGTMMAPMPMGAAGRRGRRQGGLGGAADAVKAVTSTIQPVVTRVLLVILVTIAVIVTMASCMVSRGDSTVSPALANREVSR